MPLLSWVNINVMRQASASKLAPKLGLPLRNDSFVEFGSLVDLMELCNHVHEQQRSGITILHSVVVLPLGEWPEFPVAVTHTRWAGHLQTIPNTLMIISIFPIFNRHKHSLSFTFVECRTTNLTASSWHGEENQNTQKHNCG
jgi:hypothetical protein